MILAINAAPEEVTKSTDIIIKGVCDYHGDKENWFIP